MIWLVSSRMAYTSRVKCCTCNRKRAVMVSEVAQSIYIAPSYVRRWLLRAAVIGAAVPLALGVFLSHADVAPYLLVVVAITVIMLCWVLYDTYRRALKQAVHLFPTRIVFDYLTGTQEFTFDSVRDWTLTEVGDNWKVTLLMDHTFKLIPMSAFPQFRSVAATVYKFGS